MQITLQQKQIQELNLVMTPALRQAIELLQYSTYELYDYIKEQALDNPLIELKEKHPDASDYRTPHRIRSSSNTSSLSLDWIPCDGNDMREELVQHARVQFQDPQDIQLLEYLIYNLDDNGYLFNDDSMEFTCNENALNRGIHLLQQIGPAGIGARSLKECLLLQLAYNHPEEKLAFTLIDAHFDLLANRKWDDIASLMKLTLAEVKKLHEFIKTLNPKPCSTIADFNAEYITPDIVIEESDNGLSYFLNDRYLPAVQVNTEYLSMRHQNQETAKYISDQYNQIQWLLSSIEKRRATISKIIEVVLEKQQNFFNEGFIALQPLTLKEVADEIDMHESTVSRATANKTIQTPKGTFDFRMLFTSKLETSDGDSVSQTKVKKLLQRFIAEENKQKPFSDQKIANYFKTEKGIAISRRTISKYREELNIPSSRMRKEIQI
ncbi:RNA polymerase factor sigma-54 [Sporosarcina ureilytica]|uniref:RNA polymerase sigma-54 factor n=1 Tax=Sporosarcina ureilytica TaxID=298596 RepID=A0A1D8JIN2_9BACL|nr:RNA polymerase factor sigma-54 [Sporosarcina ureilytica]AOV08578.1 RNA polymerase sigma-54 factor [Sporosarcina ureilytica]